MRTLGPLLTDAGFVTQSANGITEALEEFERQAPDLALFDLQLDGEKGFDLCRRVKWDARWKRVTVAAMAEQVDPLGLLRALEAGADGFLSLARPPAELLGAVRRIAARGPRTPPADGGRVLISFHGQPFVLGIDREHLLDVLIATFEDIDVVNTSLKREVQQRGLAEE